MGYYGSPYDEEDKRSALTQGLLAAGLAALGARKGSEYNAFAQAGLLGLGGYGRSLENATEARDRKAQREMQAQQFAQQQAEWQRAQQQRAQMEGAQRAATLPGTPGMPAQEADSPGGTYMPPTPGTPGGFDRQKYGQLLEAIDPQKGLAYQQAIAKPTRELKDTRTLMQNGKRVTVNFYKDGTSEVVPFAPDAEKPYFVSTGSKVGVPLDPFTGKPLGEGVAATMGPADAARLGLDQSKFAWEKSQAGGAGKPPEGYRWKPDGSVEPIPGGPKDTTAKDAAQAEGVIQRADLVSNKVDEVLGQSGFFTTGATGALTGRVPGSPAFDMRKNVETIKANLGFQELAAMRAASPTGGALGQVAVQELNALQASIANLDPDQSEPQLIKNLEQVKRHVKNWKALMQRAAGKGGTGATGGWSIEEVK
jgi:hypothetical protein